MSATSRGSSTASRKRATCRGSTASPSVTLTVEKRTGANLIAVADDVKAELARQEASLPEGTVVTVLGDQSKQIRRW